MRRLAECACKPSLWVCTQDNELNCVAKGDVHECPNSIPHFARNALRGVAQEPCKWNDGYSVHCKDDSWADMSYFASNSHRYEDKERVDPAGA